MTEERLLFIGTHLTASLVLLSINFNLEITAFFVRLGQGSATFTTQISVLCSIQVNKTHSEPQMLQKRIFLNIIY